MTLDPGGVSLVAELRAQERQAAEELGQWKTHHEERKMIDASQAAIECRKPSTGCAPWSACPGIPRQCLGPRAATAVGRRDRVEWDPLRGKGSFPPPPAPLEIISRNARVAALQKRRDCLRTGLDLILDQRGADMADLPSGASAMLVRGYKGKEPTG